MFYIYTSNYSFLFMVYFAINTNKLLFNMASPLSTVLNDPSWRLCNIDPQKRSFDFIQLSREQFDSSNFADESYTSNTANAEVVNIPFDEIESALTSERVNYKAHFIFHSAFCGSTLLSRALNLPGKSLSVREPHTLFQLSAMKRANPLFTAQSAEWQKIFNITLSLVSRPFIPGEITIVKPSNAMNNLIPELLNSNVNSNALFLYSGLKEFLVSNLKKGQGYEDFVNSCLGVLYSNYVPSDFDENINNIDPNNISPLKKAALLWVIQIVHFQFYYKHLPDSRKNSLHFLNFVNHPEKTLEECDSFFSLDLPKSAISDIVHSNLFRKHSKGEKSTYSLTKKQIEDEKILKSNTKLIGETLDWAYSKFPNFPFDNPL